MKTTHYALNSMRDFVAFLDRLRRPLALQIPWYWWWRSYQLLPSQNGFEIRLCKILSTGLQDDTPRLAERLRHFWNCRFKDSFHEEKCFFSSMWVDVSVITCSFDKLSTSKIQIYQMHSPLSSEWSWFWWIVWLWCLWVINKHNKLSLKWKHFLILLTSQLSNWQIS